MKDKIMQGRPRRAADHGAEAGQSKIFYFWVVAALGRAAVELDYLLSLLSFLLKAF